MYTKILSSNFVTTKCPSICFNFAAGHDHGGHFNDFVDQDTDACKKKIYTP